MKLKTISIKGKQYVTVSERVREFNLICPNGKITTTIIGQDENTVTMVATIWPDVKNPDRYFEGLAHEDKRNTMSMVNKTSHIENCQTSAVGRALALAGIGIIDGIASADEVTKAINAEKRMVGEEIEVSDTQRVTIPACSACGKAMFRAQTKQGKQFWTCPDWKKHKDEGQKSEAIWPEEVVAIDPNKQPF